MAACSVATRPSPNEKSRPEAAHVDAFISGTIHVALMQCPGHCWESPGAIPTVDFLLSYFRAAAKKNAVKSLHAINASMRQSDPFFERPCPAMTNEIALTPAPAPASRGAGGAPC